MPRPSTSLKAVLIAQRIADAARQASTLASIAVAQSECREDSLSTLAKALAIADKAKDPVLRCRSLCDIAAAECAVGLVSTGTLQRAEALAMDCSADVRPLIYVYLTYARLGRHAESNFRAALALASEIESPWAADEVFMLVSRAVADLSPNLVLDEVLPLIHDPLQRIAAYCEVSASIHRQSPERSNVAIAAARTLLRTIDPGMPYCEALCLVAVAEGITGRNSDAALSEVRRQLNDLPSAEDRDYITCQLVACYAQLHHWEDAEVLLRALPDSCYRDSALAALISSYADANTMQRAEISLQRLKQQPYFDLALKAVAIAQAR